MYFGEYLLENFVELTSDELVIQIRLYSRFAVKIEVELGTRVSVVIKDRFFCKTSGGVGGGSRISTSFVLM